MFAGHVVLGKGQQTKPNTQMDHKMVLQLHTGIPHSHSNNVSCVWIQAETITINYINPSTKFEQNIDTIYFIKLNLY